MADRPDVPDEMLQRLRATFDTFPEIAEERAWVGVRWQVGKVTVAHAFGGEDQRFRVTFRAELDEVPAFENLGEPYFRAGWGSNVVGLLLDDDTDWDEVAELLTDSYCIQAPATSLRRCRDRAEPGHARVTASERATSVGVLIEVRIGVIRATRVPDRSPSSCGHWTGRPPTSPRGDDDQPPVLALDRRSGRHRELASARGEELEGSAGEAVGGVRVERGERTVEEQVLIAGVRDELGEVGAEGGDELAGGVDVALVGEELVVVLSVDLHRDVGRPRPDGPLTRDRQAGLVRSAPARCCGSGRVVGPA